MRPSSAGGAHRKKDHAMKPWARYVVGSGLALLLLAWAATGVFAHAELLGSDPADGAAVTSPPDQIRLFFSEPLEPEFYSIQVYATDRARVDRNDTAISPTDPRILQVSLGDASPGTYTVAWRAFSLDGHVVRGSFAFAIGAGSTPTRPITLTLPAEGAPFSVESAARWLTFLLLFLLLGGLAFRPLLLDPTMRALGRHTDELTPVLVRRWLWLAWPALGLLIVVSFAALVFQAASAAGLPLGEVLSGRAVSRLLMSTRYGWLWLVRIVLLVGLAGTLAWIAAAPWTSSRVAWWVGVATSGLALLTISASGHASAVPERPLLAIAMDWLHMAAAGLWVGGLVHLGLTLPAALARVDAGERRAVLGRLVPRFSVVAGVAVAVLVATGVYSSLLHVPSLAALMDTTYGAALTMKLLIFAVLLGIAAINLLVIHPRFRAALASRRKRQDDASGRRAFRWLVLGEVVAAVLVLAVTGVLTGLPPAGSIGLEPQPVSETQPAGAVNVAFAVRPNQAGENRIELALTDARGAPVVDAQRVTLILTMLDMEMGSREVTPEPSEPGRYGVQGSQLSMAGHWRADVAVRQGGTDSQAQFSFTVGPAPGANRPAFSPARIVLNAVNGQSFLAVVLLASAVVLLVRGPRFRRRDRRWATIGAAGLVLVGLVAGGTSVADAYRRSLPNPIPVTAASLARGQEIYQAQCATCHGDNGRGDGLAGRFLRPRPADFRVHMAAGHTDPDLFGWVSNGVQGTAMPAFGDTLSEEDRWHVINYIRQFANATAADERNSPAPASPIPAASPEAVLSSATASPTISPSPETIRTDVAPSLVAPPAPAQPAASSPVPREAWRVVGHWQNQGLITTPEFTVHGPWRIRWQLENTDERCFVMIEEDVTKAPLLLSGDPGATAGIFHQDRAGSYRLMLHNTTPYDIVVEEATGEQEP